MLKRIFLASMLIIPIVERNANAFWLNTHEKITSHAIVNVNLNNVLKDCTGIDNALGIKVTVSDDTKALQQWMEYGSRQEDEPLLSFRYLNHFYNPINDSGLWGYYSSYDWANNNDWDWRTARSNYLLGLTSSTDTARKTALANSFRALGQVMHLVQDLASPAHVRADAHPLGDGFEKYAANHSLSFLGYAFNNHNNSVSTSAPRQIWDTDIYTGQNPDDTTRYTVGLAEYTNANFFSEDTMFTFTYPSKKTSVIIAEKDIPDPVNQGSSVKREYYFKVADGETNNGNGYLLAGVDYLNFYRDSLIDPSLASPTKTIPPMDDLVYEAYANLLIPRAVGYSAGLLNYFFRGDTDMVPDETGTAYQIINKSGETMEGTFTLYYDSSLNGIRYPVLKDEYGGAKGWKLTLPPGAPSKPITFPQPSYPKVRGQYMLAFEGSLGNEMYAVAGKWLPALCEDAEWQYVTNLYYGGGNNFGDTYATCVEEQTGGSFKYDLDYQCVYIAENGNCPTITQDNIPTCAPKDINACSYVPSGAKACGPRLYSATVYVKGCPQQGF